VVIVSVSLSIIEVHYSGLLPDLWSESLDHLRLFVDETSHTLHWKWFYYLVYFWF